MEKICECCQNAFTTDRSARRFCSQECANRSAGEQRAAAEPAGKLVRVWSCGGGVQSTAIAALIYMGKLPKPDYGIMVDVGFERTQTMEYMQSVIMPKMAEIGLPFQMIPASDYTEVRFTDGQGHVNIPAFKRREDGKISLLDTRCNGTWKLTVSRRWMREQGIKRCENWIGISSDEDRRARGSNKRWITYRYPLIELGMDRDECLYEIGQAGWPLPTRSSCVFCPMQTRKQWERQRNLYPQDWAKVLKVEALIRAEAPDVFLCRECVPMEDWLATPPA